MPDPSTPPTPLRRRVWQTDAFDGQVLVIFALFSLVLIGGLALSIDTGYLMSERRQVQSAADAGAMAAGKAALDNKAAAEITAAGQSYGNTNGGTGAVTVVYRPPATGAHIGDSNYVQVKVTKSVTKFFIGAVYNGAWQVSASATAGIQPEGFDAALLALNSNAGGINANNSTRINVVGGSVVSNYNIATSGDIRITADQWVVANNGISQCNGCVVSGTQGTNASAPEIPDPLASKISPPSLPAFPANPVPSVNPSGTGCGTGLQKPGWNAPYAFQFSPGPYTSGGGGCLTAQGNTPNGETFHFLNGQWKFTNGAGINLASLPKVIFDGGTYNFSGATSGIVNNSSAYVELDTGKYSFSNGAALTFQGNAPNNNVCVGSTGPADCVLYFAGGGGLNALNSDNLTLNPGTYIFDGGPGLTMSGNNVLTFNTGEYVFWFRNGADLTFSGSSSVALSGNPHVKMYFYGTGSASAGPISGCPTSETWSDLCMSGDTNFKIPSGEYYFDRGRLIGSGSTAVSGNNVLLYFKNGGFLSSTGGASFGFTAPTTTVYPGYYPGVFMYSDAANTASFWWQGTTSAVSKGAIYLPSSPLNMSGGSNGVSLQGQVIVDRLVTSGNTALTVEFVEYVKTQTPKLWLVE